MKKEKLIRVKEMHQKEFSLWVCSVIWRYFPTCPEMKIYSCRLLLDVCLLNKCEITTMVWQSNCIFSIWMWILPQLPMLLQPFLLLCSTFISSWGWHNTLQLSGNVLVTAVFCTEHKLHLYCKICLTLNHFSGWCSDLHSLDQDCHRYMISRFLPSSP